MVDLEDAQATCRMRVAQPEGLESGAQHDRLAHTALHGLGQRLLGEAAARGDEQAQRPQALVARPLVGLEAALDAENLAREGIAKDATLLQQLMRGAMPGGSARGEARPIVLHASRYDLDATTLIPLHPNVRFSSASP